MRLKRTYSSREVAAMTGLSARQLQVWDTGRLLSPAIPPHRTAAGGYTERRYTPIELFELLVLADLRHLGFSVRQLHQILQALKQQFGARLFEATGGGGSAAGERKRNHQGVGARLRDSRWKRAARPECRHRRWAARDVGGRHWTRSSKWTGGAQGGHEDQERLRAVRRDHALPSRALPRRCGFSTNGEIRSAEGSATGHGGAR